MADLAIVLGYEVVEDVPETRVDLGGGEQITPEHFSNPGIDSAPLPEDHAALVNGRSVVGYSGGEAVAEPGECRMFARDTNGNTVCSVYLKKDGSIEVDAPDKAIKLTNGAGSIEIGTSGTVDINGNFTVDP